MSEHLFHGTRPFHPPRVIRDQRHAPIHNLLAGQARPSTGIDGDPAWRLSRQEKYAATEVRTVFDTFADPPEYELYDLESDPWRKRPLAGRPELAAVQKRLTEAPRRWREDIKDTFVDPKHVK